MMNDSNAAAPEKGTNTASNGNHRLMYYGGFVLLIALYVANTFFLNRISRSPAMIVLGQNRLPIASFTGVLSSTGNILLILMVV